MARETDFAGIRQLLKPLEDSGTLIRRTDEEVCYFRYSNTPVLCLFMNVGYITTVKNLWPPTLQHVTNLHLFTCIMAIVTCSN